LEQIKGSQVGNVSLMLSLILVILIYFGGVFMQPLIYAYIIQVISTQINNLNTYFKTGIKLKIHNSFVNIFSLSSFRWDEKWSFISIKMQTLDNNCQTKRIRVIVMTIPFAFFDDKYYDNNGRHLCFCHSDKSFRFFSNGFFLCH
jgi:hypothetical protein